MTGKNHRFAVVFIVSAIVLCGCDFYYKNMPFVPIPPQTVSGPVEIGSDWIEIIPPEPLRPIVKSQWINLGYFGYSKVVTVIAKRKTA